MSEEQRSSLSPFPMERPPPPEPPHRPLYRLLVIGGIVVAVLLAAMSLTPRQLTEWDEAWLAPTAIIAVLMTTRLVVSRQALGSMGGQMLAVLGFGAVLAIGYSYRGELGAAADRALGAIVPSRGVEIAPATMRFTADDSGQFFIDAVVHRDKATRGKTTGADATGVGVHFLVDTGASGVTLSRADARRLGFDPGDLSYTQRFSTANGATRGAPVTLDRIQIGSLSADRVRASVNEGDLNVSLLGISYLSTLGRLEIKGDRMTIER